MLRLTADGCQEVLVPTDLGCCPPPLCGNDLCCTFVAFFNLLPSGPMWDFWKAEAITYFQSNDDPAECPLVANPQCPSIVLHSIYTVLKLRKVVHDGLWVALRESSPYTAVTTLDDHLRRLQWEDCYAQHCRSVLLGEITPLELWSPCGPIFCPPDYTPELELALKKNIAIALTRAGMGVVKNQCGINWVIEPLGAEIISDPITLIPCVDPPDEFDPPPDCVDPPDEFDRPKNCDDCDPSVCKDQAFIIRPTRDWIEGVGSGDVCDANKPFPRVPSSWDRSCDKPAGLPDKVWPGVLAAECIVRSMLPPACPSNITREC